MEDMDVDQIEGSAGAADDTEGVRQRLLSERRAVKRHYYRAEHGIAYFLRIASLDSDDLTGFTPGLAMMTGRISRGWHPHFTMPGRSTKSLLPFFARFQEQGRQKPIRRGETREARSSRLVFRSHLDLDRLSCGPRRAR